MGNPYYSLSDGYMPFLSYQYGYSIFATRISLESCTGYERWRLHWKHPATPDYITAHNAANTDYVNSDISKANGNLSFTLRDFVTDGDAIRIKLPYKDDNASNQYIWLENHKIGSNNKLDFLHWSDNPANDCRPKGAAGIYAYYQIGRDILSGRSDEVWHDNERDNLRMMPAEGYWDFAIHKVDTYRLGCISWEPYSHYFSRETANSFCGYHDMESQFHADNTDNILMRKHQYPMIRKKIGNQFIDSLVSNGDNRDAFSTHTKINMATNPSTCNAKTYYNNTASGMSTFEFTAHAHRNNQTTYLTGLSIEMIPQSNKDVKVNIRWDDYDITNNARWAGKISNMEQVNLVSGNTIELVQNRTPAQFERDPVSGLFAPPTVLTCEQNSIFTQQPNTSVIVSEKSKLVLKNESVYTISQKATLIVEAGCMLEIEDGAILNLDGLLEIYGKATIGNATVKAGSNGKIIVYTGGELVRNRG